MPIGKSAKIANNILKDVDLIRTSMNDYTSQTLSIIENRSLKWGSAWRELRNKGLEDMIHIKAHRLCFCPPSEKRECLIDLLSYMTMRWYRLDNPDSEPKSERKKNNQEKPKSIEVANELIPVTLNRNKEV